MEKSLEDIAHHFQLTPEQLNAHLKKRTGRGAESFREEVRLNKALELMTNPNLNLYQIVEECGYSDVGEFHLIFRRKFHMSPAEYRRQFL